MSTGPIRRWSTASTGPGRPSQWLTGWPVTREAALLLRPGERDLLFVCFNNHVPNARRLAPDADVRPGNASALDAALDALASRADRGSTASAPPGPGRPRRPARPTRLGVIGPVPARASDRLAATAGEIVFLDREYTRLRLVKSAEELAWMRTGAAMSDDAVAALAAAARPGMTEAECCATLEGAYIAAGGLTHIHYLGVTAMAEPGLCVPAQWPSPRRLRAGDVLTCEVSASYQGYPGQLLRTFTIAAPATPLYEDLHRVAAAAFDAMAARLRAGAAAGDLTAAAAEIILGAGYTIYDDLVHGFGGGYLPPVISRADRAGMRRRRRPRRLHLRGGHDGRPPAERDHARRAGGRPDRRAGAGHRVGLGAAAPVPARPGPHRRLARAARPGPIRRRRSRPAHIGQPGRAARSGARPASMRGGQAGH